jgi:hypothetical protein
MGIIGGDGSWIHVLLKSLKMDYLVQDDAMDDSY